jgi:hypothetical protein
MRFEAWKNARAVQTGAPAWCLRRPGGSFVKPPPGPPQNFSYADSQRTTLLNILPHWNHLHSVSKEGFVIGNFLHFVFIRG